MLRILSLNEIVRNSKHEYRSLLILLKLTFTIRLQVSPIQLCDTSFIQLDKFTFKLVSHQLLSFRTE
jgi:hypothetical protein